MKVIVYLHQASAVIEVYVKQVSSDDCPRFFFCFFFSLSWGIWMILHLLTFVNIFTVWGRAQILSWFAVRCFPSGQRWKVEASVKKERVSTGFPYMKCTLRVTEITAVEYPPTHIFGLRQSLGKDSFGFSPFSLGQQWRNFKSSKFSHISSETLHLCIIWWEDMRMTHGVRMRYLLANSLLPVVTLTLSLKHRLLLFQHHWLQTKSWNHPNDFGPTLYRFIKHLFDFVYLPRGPPLCVTSLVSTLAGLCLLMTDPTHLTHFLLWMGYLFRVHSGGPDHVQKHNHLLFICPSRTKTQVCIGRDVHVRFARATPRFYL